MTEQCIHCRLCTQNCAFLEKYSMDLAAFAAHPELAYHCFLCGKCTSVCPQGIDGRTIALTMRRGQVQQCGGTLTEPGYRFFLTEKQNYLFKNYRRTNGATALFPGCNFPSFFPKTTDVLIQLLREADIGVVFDCCGKPIGDLGLDTGEDACRTALCDRLAAAGITRLVVLCPNCFHYLKDHLDIEIISIYTLLAELGLGTVIEGAPAPIFLPCPDRESRELLRQLGTFLPHADPIDDIQCCGLGGCAAGKEPDIAASFGDALLSRQFPTVYTYCASCAGQLRRCGVAGARHVLTEILATHEKPVLSPVHSLWNRAKRVF